MRYAIFTDIHANLEALEAVLAKIDEISEKKHIDQIWFLGDLVGYGPNPNECIKKLRERTEVIIAGNHDWAAVGKIDLEDFSAAARISAEWTAMQLTEENRDFLANLPERLEIGDCTLVHGSPYGPLWEYLTSDVLAERSFQYFTTRYCFVGHTHVPVIFQQPDPIANTPTLPLTDMEQNALLQLNGDEDFVSDEDDDETTEMAAISPSLQTIKAARAESAYADPDTGRPVTEETANALHDPRNDEVAAEDAVDKEETTEAVGISESEASADEIESQSEDTANKEEHSQGTDAPTDDHNASPVSEMPPSDSTSSEEPEDAGEAEQLEQENTDDRAIPEEEIAEVEERLDSEIEELLELLGLSESMIQVTNEMLTPPEGHWELAEGYRAIINAGGVGQPRDGDPRAAFMIYDTEEGFEFYRIHYPFNKTQEKILKVGLPPYLAVRLAYGR